MPPIATSPVSLLRPGDRARFAPVIDLATRRKRDPDAEPAEVPKRPSAEEAVEFAASYWDGVFAAAGLDFVTPVPASVVVPLITAELERLVGGLMTVRDGGGPRNLPPNPGAGMDAVSAMECAALLRELCAVAERGRARSQEEPC
jgi:hypothetical protein